MASAEKVMPTKEGRDVNVMFGQVEATDKLEPSMTGQRAGNVMLVEKGMYPPTIIIELCQTDDASSATYPCKYTYSVSRCQLGLAVNLI